MHTNWGLQKWVYFCCTTFRSQENRHFVFLYFTSHSPNEDGSWNKTSTFETNLIHWQIQIYSCLDRNSNGLNYFFKSKRRTDKYSIHDSFMLWRFCNIKKPVRHTIRKGNALSRINWLIHRFTVKILSASLQLYIAKIKTPFFFHPPFLLLVSMLVQQVPLFSLDIHFSGVCFSLFARVFSC